MINHREHAHLKLLYTNTGGNVRMGLCKKFFLFFTSLMSIKVPIYTHHRMTQRRIVGAHRKSKCNFINNATTLRSSTMNKKFFCKLKQLKINGFIKFISFFLFVYVKISYRCLKSMRWYHAIIFINLTVK